MHRVLQGLLMRYNRNDDQCRIQTYMPIDSVKAFFTVYTITNHPLVVVVYFFQHYSNVYWHKRLENLCCAPLVELICIQSQNWIHPYAHEKSCSNLELAIFEHWLELLLDFGMTHHIL